jgi:uncharacterized protein (TIGR03086 family)
MVTVMTESTPTPDLTPAAEGVKALLEGVRDDQLGVTTPCAPWSVGDLLEHFMGLTLAFAAAAEKSTDPAVLGTPPEPSVTRLDRAWRRVLPERLDAVAAAWRKPDAWTGAASVGGVTLPADAIGLFGLNELVMHGWDLARTTGQRFDVDPGNVTAVLGLLSGMPPENQVFGPPVPVGPDASPLDRALGLAGRDPAWQP